MELCALAAEEQDHKKLMDSTVAVDLEFWSPLYCRGEQPMIGHISSVLQIHLSEQCGVARIRV
jgi:hypothetical protein